MKAVWIIALVLSLSATRPVNASCNLTEKCPIDGVASGRVGTEYAAMVEIGIYGHALLTGGEHSFRVRCN
jgi:hypothetical protein